MRSLMLLPALLLISACGQSPSIDAGEIPGDLTNEKSAASRDSASALAVKDCVSAGAQVAAVIEGMELMPDQGQSRVGSLSCTWWGRKGDRVFSFVVNTMHSNTSIEKDVKLLTAANYSRLTAPEIDSRGGSALWRDVTAANGRRAVDLMVILPEAQVILSHGMPPESVSQMLQPVEAVELTGKLLKL